MTKPTISQSQKRFNESVGALFLKDDPKKEATCLFLKSSTDIGVIRNGGRNGARFAPQSLLATIKKFSQNNVIKNFSFTEIEVASEAAEKENFHEAQEQEAGKILSNLKSYPKSRVYHIGGGHDHAYPLLKAYSSLYKKIIVINIDAHADTRTDENFHSGTPFRQFAQNFGGEFHIFQIGLHPFANSFSTLTPLSRGKSKELWFQDVNQENLNSFFSEIRQLIDDQTFVLFSLDCDALAGHEVPGVSAVNPAGLSRQNVLSLWENYKKLPLSHAPVMGIYELNPLYDTLASLSMRTIGSLIFEGI